MKKKIIISVILIVLIGTAAVFGYNAYSRWQEDQAYIRMEDSLIPRDLTEIILTEDTYYPADVLVQLTALKQIDARQYPLTVAEYEALKATVPNAVIMWNVPFQGQYLPEDTQELEIAGFAQTDLALLHYFPKLHTIDLGLVQDFGLIDMLQQSCPEISLRYSISLGDISYPQNTAQLELVDADLEELSAVLPYLPQLREISFVGSVPDSESIYRLMETHPEISFLWDLEVLGITTSNSVTTLDFSGIPMKSTADVEEYLKYFPNLERVEMCDCGISSEEMDALSKRHPSIKFIWTIKIRGKSLRTDVTAFIPYKLGFNIDTPLYDSDCRELKYCTDLICLDMGHMKIRDVSFLNYMPKMQYLILVDMSCRDFTPLGNLKEMIYLELFNVRFTQHDLLLNMTKLEDLNISSTPTADIEVLRQMTWLDRLWITRTHLSKEQLYELKNALPDTHVEWNALHSTDKGWRDNDNYRKMRDLLGMHYMD